MAFRFVILLVLSIVCLAAPAWADFETGMDAAHRGDYATALREWRPLAERGDVRAQAMLGGLYHDGKGVPQDYAHARQWFLKAALRGFADAERYLGDFYLHGLGVEDDSRQALYWYRRAVDHGSVITLRRFGMMYHLGTGVPRDSVEAHKWYNLVAANGDKHGAELRDVLAKEMTPAQITEAQKLAREWKPNSK